MFFFAIGHRDRVDTVILYDYTTTAAYYNNNNNSNNMITPCGRSRETSKSLSGQGVRGLGYPRPRVKRPRGLFVLYPQGK